MSIYTYVYNNMYMTRIIYIQYWTTLIQNDQAPQELLRATMDDLWMVVSPLKWILSLSASSYQQQQKTTTTSGHRQPQRHHRPHCHGHRHRHRHWKNILDMDGSKKHRDAKIPKEYPKISGKCGPNMTKLPTEGEPLSKWLSAQWIRCQL